MYIIIQRVIPSIYINYIKYSCMILLPDIMTSIDITHQKYAKPANKGA